MWLHVGRSFMQLQRRATRQCSTSSKTCLFIQICHVYVHFYVWVKIGKFVSLLREFQQRTLALLVGSEIPETEASTQLTLPRFP